MVGSPPSLRRRWAAIVGALLIGAGWCTQVGLVVLVATPLHQVGFRAMGVAGSAAAVSAVAAAACVLGALTWSLGGRPSRPGRLALAALAAVLPWVVTAMLVAPALRGIVAPERPGPGEHFSVLVQNLWYRHDDPARIAAEVLGSDEDVLVLVEFTPEHEAAFVAAGGLRDYPHHWLRPAPRGKGMAVLSRLPLGRATDVGASGGGHIGGEAVEMRLRVGDRDVTLVAVHPVAPSNYWGLLTWRRDYANLTDFARDLGPDAIVAGDFNATHLHRWYRRFVEAGDLRDALDVSGSGLAATWPARRVYPPVMRLDRILVGPGIGVAGAGTLPRWGSDHLGVRAELVVEGP